MPAEIDKTPHKDRKKDNSVLTSLECWRNEETPDESEGIVSC